MYPMSFMCIKTLCNERQIVKPMFCLGDRLLACALDFYVIKPFESVYEPKCPNVV